MPYWVWFLSSKKWNNCYSWRIKKNELEKINTSGKRLLFSHPAAHTVYVKCQEDRCSQGLQNTDPQYCYGSLSPHLPAACGNGHLETVQQQLHVCWLLLGSSCIYSFPHFSVPGLFFVFSRSSHATGDPCKPQWFNPAYPPISCNFWEGERKRVEMKEQSAAFK